MLIKLFGIQILIVPADAIVMVGRKKREGKKKQDKSLKAAGKNDSKPP